MNPDAQSLLLLLLLSHSLYRFQDGKICEAVVWEGVPPSERHKIPDLAVQHVLLRHLPGGTVVQSCSTALDHLLYPSYCPAKGSADVTIDSGADVKPSTAGSAPNPAAAAAARSAAVQIGSHCTSAAAAAETAASRSADTASDSLAKQLRGLSDVALKVIGVQALSAVSRHTCCFYPEPHPLADHSGGVVLGQGGVKVPRVLEAIEVMVQLEGSGAGLFEGEGCYTSTLHHLASIWLTCDSLGVCEYTVFRA